jgi:hypothetical protein
MALTRAHFRLIRTECCICLLCWVNPRLPNFCPECGQRIFPDVRSWVTFSDDQAYIKHKVDDLVEPKPVRSETSCRVPSGRHRYGVDGRCVWCDAEGPT